jgi:hypothetical protein
MRASGMPRRCTEGIASIPASGRFSGAAYACRVLVKLVYTLFGGLNLPVGKKGWEKGEKGGRGKKGDSLTVCRR